MILIHMFIHAISVYATVLPDTRKSVYPAFHAQYYHAWSVSVTPLTEPVASGCVMSWFVVCVVVVREGSFISPVAGLLGA